MLDYSQRIKNECKILLENTLKLKLFMTNEQKVKLLISIFPIPSKNQDHDWWRWHHDVQILFNRKRTM